MTVDVMAGGKQLRMTSDDVVRKLRGAKPGQVRTHAVKVQGVLHPVKSGIAEHRIEARAEVHVGGSLLHDRESEPPRRRHEVGTGVNAHYIAAKVGDLLGQQAVATPHIQDVFTGPGSEQFEDRSTEFRDKAGVLVVTLGIPGLRHHEIGNISGA